MAEDPFFEATLAFALALAALDAGIADEIGTRLRRVLASVHADASAFERAFEWLARFEAALGG